MVIINFTSESSSSSDLEVSSVASLQTGIKIASSESIDETKRLEILSKTLS